jgi:Domain of unknown function (DUF4372)
MAADALAPQSSASVRFKAPASDQAARGRLPGDPKPSREVQRWETHQLRAHRASPRRRLGRAHLVVCRAVRALAFAQLTSRESLRDIETTLSANAAKLYAMGFRAAVKRSTLADANESRDWRIWADFAALLIRRARKLYATESAPGIDLDNTVNALDSSAVDLCLSLFA